MVTGDEVAYFATKLKELEDKLGALFKETLGKDEAEARILLTAWRLRFDKFLTDQGILE